MDTYQAGGGHAATETTNEKTVVLSVQGGLGNQLFEWAFAKALQTQGHEVLFDTIRCRGSRPLMIGPLLWPGSRLSPALGLAAVAAYKSGILNGRFPMRVVQEGGFSYDPSLVSRLGSRSYLVGYFQSPRYFDVIADSVRTELSAFLDGMLTREGKALAKDLASDQHSVAVHVRRGDYVTNPVASAHHGALQGDYYRSALTMMEELGHVRHVWFSDDPGWVTENLARPGEVVCGPEFAYAAGGEIALMASCSSRVIANSSFSWWGGWLGRRSTPQNPVIAPARWFVSDQNSTSDLLPHSWIKL
ncbi:alpha-1,2-fucosyltransferase [Pseudarthrobacter sulfonivorans]|uniref:alpha-1,2-fucosyltransferase n=1 Tax=Pseudarthrobacter sulfonivorans TaxID=121292 RepID=UPI002864ED32|nr:alpha-1,2-fucosyltransferase [Pseudarthrobacter sulfonivorans]MDR6413308.1 hypothetical protein [Pseudarthrobacter sulfonivorans]